MYIYAWIVSACLEILGLYYACVSFFLFHVNLLQQVFRRPLSACFAFYVLWNTQCDSHGFTCMTPVFKQSDISADPLPRLSVIHS